MSFSKHSESYKSFNNTEFEQEGTSIQMLPDINTDDKEIDKFIVLELIKVAADLTKPSIKEGYLEESINSRFVAIYEQLLKTYLCSIIK